MNKLKIMIAVATLLLIALSVSCSKTDDNLAATTVTEHKAVDVFNPVTEKTSYVKLTTWVFDEITETITETVKENDVTKKTSNTSAATKPVTTVPTTTMPETTVATTTARQTVKVTINEGDTLTQIFKKLDENGVADFDALMETAQNYDYSYYPLVAGIPSDPNRCFRLEGYLFPDTYEFYVDQKPQDAIGKFLRVGKARITDSMKSQALSLGYSMDEILTVASIIEKEGANSNEVSKIAAVIYNRLEAGMKLQMDSSIYYIERHVKPYISGDINRYNSYYNTYKCSALPAGPISNPGMRTINAALNPADVDYLYFCHDENANYYYADTYEEHQENLKKAGLTE